MENKNSRTSEAVKTVILTILVVCLIILVIIYIGGTHIYQTMTDTGEKKVFDKLWSVQSGQYSDGLNVKRAMPELVAYKFAGSSSVCTKDSTSTETIYELISPCIVELFGSGSTCEEISEAEGRTIYLSYTTGSEYIYLRWHEELLYQLIYAYSSDRVAISESDTAVFVSTSNSGAYIKEIIIVPENDVAAHRFTAVAKDSNGRYFLFKRNAEAVASEFHISKLSDASSKINALPFEFVTNENCDTEPMILSELTFEDIDVTSAAIPTGEQLNSILKLFGYNLDKLNSYSYEGLASYNDSHSRIRFRNGSISYKAVDTDSGTGLYELLGYSADDGYSLFDKLSAIDCFLTAIYDISPEIIGNKADLNLGNVYTEEGLLVFEYFYTYANIRISNSVAVKAVLSQSTLYSLDIQTINCEPNGEYTIVPNGEYVINKLKSSGKLNNEKISVRTVYENGKAVRSAVLKNN